MQRWHMLLFLSIAPIVWTISAAYHRNANGVTGSVVCILLCLGFAFRQRKRDRRVR
jgi:hypothetical protein